MVLSVNLIPHGVVLLFNYIVDEVVQLARGSVAAAAVKRAVNIFSLQVGRGKE